MRRDSLATYRAKRDFHQTAEPSGAASVPAGSQLRYVISSDAAARSLAENYVGLPFSGKFAA